MSCFVGTITAQDEVAIDRLPRADLLQRVSDAASDQEAGHPRQRAICEFVLATLPQYAEPIPNPNSEQVERAYAFALAASAIRAGWPESERIRGLVNAGRNAARACSDIAQIVYWDTRQAKKDLLAGNATSAVELTLAAIELSDRSPATTIDEIGIRDPQVAIALLCAIGAQLELADYDAARRTIARLDALCGDRGDLRFARIPGFGAESQLELEIGRIDRAQVAADRQLELAVLADRAGDQAEAIGRAMNIDLAIRQFQHAIERCDAFLASPVAERVAASARAELEIRKGQATCEIQRADPSRAQDAIDILTKALSEPDISPRMRSFGTLTLAESYLLAGRFTEAKATLDSIETAISSLAPASAASSAVLPSRLVSLRAALELAAPGSLGISREDLARQIDDAIARMFADWERRRATARVLPFLNWMEHRELLAMRIATIEHGAPTPADREAEVSLLLRAQEHGSLAESIGEKGASISTVRERLVGPANMLWMYLPAVSGSFVLTIDAEEIRCFPLPSSRILDDSTQELARALSSAPAVRAAADRPWERPEFVERFIPSVLQAKLATRHELTIVGFDLLGGFPFEALVVNGRPLGVSHAVVLSPSVPVSLALERRAQDIVARNLEVDICALDRPRSSARVAKGEAAILPPDDAMLETLNSSYGSSRVAFFAGEDATVERLSQPARILQIFAHGLFEDEEEGVCIALSSSSICPDGRLSRRAVPHGVAGLVLQMSCSAAFGALARGEDGLSHFGGAWIEAGASTVILPSRDVSIVGTQEFLAHFHTALAGRGVSPAEAARVARETLASDPRFSDPYYHALIHVYGYGRESVVPARPPEAHGTLLTIRVVLGAVVGIAFLVIRFVRRSSTRVS